MSVPFYTKNFGYGTIASGINNAVTSMTMNNGHNFPLVTTSLFRLIIWDSLTYPNPADDPNLEIVTANYSGSLNVYTIIRAQESTVAVAHSSGASCAMTITAGVIQQFGLNIPYVSGTALETYSMQLVSGTTSSSYQKLKELSPMIRSGVVSVSFAFSSSNTETCNAKIYVNGIAVGTLRTVSNTSPTTYTEDITVINGDLLQIYANGPANVGVPRICNMKVLVTVPSLPQDLTNSFGKVYRGAGVPNSIVGDQGDIYLRTDGSTSTTLYINTAPSTWTAK